jgi:hypothetical protein
MTKTYELKADLSQREKILIAAAELGADTPEEPIAAHDIVRRVHARFPEDFSLGGEGPPMADSNKVFAKLAGPEGLRGKGYLEAAGTRQFRLTKKGWREIARLTVPEPKPLKKRVRKPKRLANLSAADKHYARHYASLPTFLKSTRGAPLTYADACSFWGVSPTRPDLTKVEEAGTLFERLVAELRAYDVKDASVPSYATCAGLLNLHLMMRRRFAGQLGG